MSGAPLQQDPRLRHIEVLSSDDPIAEPVRERVSVPPPPPPVEAIASAAGGGLAQRLQARYEALRAERTMEFAVPGWGGDVILVAKKLTKVPKVQGESSGYTARFIAAATDHLILVNDAGDRERVDSWRGLADLIGVEAHSASALIMVVLDNHLRLESFGTRIVEWMVGETAEDEQTLGE
jgi:hypothetical protein